jgi:hypothetical protein
MVMMISSWPKDFTFVERNTIKARLSKARIIMEIL